MNNQVKCQRSASRQSGGIEYSSDNAVYGQYSREMTERTTSVSGESVVEKVTLIETRLQSDNEAKKVFPIFFQKSDDISKKSFIFAANFF